MMFSDVVICDYPLPLPEEASDLEAPPVWGEVEFYTTSFSMMWVAMSDDPDPPVKYSIEDNGYIYKEEQGGGGVEKVDYTGELVLNMLHMEENDDYWIEFCALFWKGDLKEIKLNEWKKYDNSKRIEAQERVHKVFTDAVKKQESKSYKITNFLKPIPRFFLGMTKYMLGFILSLVWWLEGKLR